MGCKNIVKGCDPEMISRTFQDHNLDAQPLQLATAKPIGPLSLIKNLAMIGEEGDG